MGTTDGSIKVMQPVLQVVELGSQVNTVFVMEYYLETQLVLAITCSVS